MSSPYIYSFLWTHIAEYFMRIRIDLDTRNKNGTSLTSKYHLSPIKNTDRRGALFGARNRVCITRPWNKATWWRRQSANSLLKKRRRIKKY